MNKFSIKIPLERKIVGLVRKEIAPTFKKINDLFQKVVKVEHKVKVSGVPEQIETQIKMPKKQKVEVTNLKDLPKPVVKVEKTELNIPDEFRITNLDDIPKTEITTEKVEFPEIQKVRDDNIKDNVKEAFRDVITEMATNPEQAVNVRGIGFDEGKPFFTSLGGGGTQTGAKASFQATDYFVYNVPLTASGVIYPFTFPSNTVGFFVKVRSQSTKVRMRSGANADDPFFTIPQNGWWTAFSTKLQDKIIYLQAENKNSEVAEIIAFVR